MRLAEARFICIAEAIARTPWGQRAESVAYKNQQLSYFSY